MLWLQISIFIFYLLCFGA